MRKFGCVLAGVFSIGILLFILIATLKKDDIGPEIQILQDDSFAYYDGMSEEELLEYISVIDRNDGDVSDSLMIESVEIMESANTAKLILVAVDSRYNVTRKVCELPYDSKASSSNEKIQDEVESAENIQDMPQQNQADHPLEDSIELINDYAMKTEQEIAALPSGCPQMRLSTYEITLESDDSFYYGDYIDSIVDDKDDRRTLYNQIQVNNNMDRNTSGEYEVAYYVTDSDGNKSNIAILHVLVP